MRREGERGGTRSNIVKRFRDLPPPLVEQVLQARIGVDEAQANFDSLLNALHIRTKERFYTKEGLDKMRKTRVRYPRRHMGPSTVSPDIVSTLPLDQEEKELLEHFEPSDYTFVKKLGKGGFGHVFLAEENKTLLRVAIKKMPHLTEKHQRKNFQEIRFLRYCTQHNASGIIKFRRAAVIQDEMWLLTEEIDGGTLTQAVSRHKFSEPEIAYIVHELLAGLRFLHDNLIAHRDMKSGNIVIGKNGVIKIIDFGLCSDVSRGEVVHRVGSPFWLPPEMINHEPHGVAVDVWSFGICCMEMVNSHPPEHQFALRAMFVASTVGYPQPIEDPSCWSECLVDFVSRAVVKNPKERWTVAQLQEHEFVGKRTDIATISEMFTNLFGP